MAERRKTTSWERAKADGRFGQLVNLRSWAMFEENERDIDAAIPVYLHISKNNRGRWVCTGLIVGDLEPAAWHPREINAATLRDIRIPELIAQAIRTGDIPDEYGAAVRRLLATAPTSATRPGRGGYPPSHYEEIAALYRRALAESPHAPTKWLAEQQFIAQSTARRWVGEARKRGLLGKTEGPGKAGG